MEYNLQRREWSTVCDYYEITVDPKDYLECENEDELIDTIIDDMWNVGSDETEYEDTYESENDIPEEFIAEWKKLKGIE